jgi:predicted GIY-YIG superfamily endonuclease
MPAVNFYKIVCSETKRVYVGSTCRPIERRLKEHEQDYKRYLLKRYHFTSSFIVLEKNNYNIVLIDSVLCNDKKR